MKLGFIIITISIITLLRAKLDQYYSFRSSNKKVCLKTLLQASTNHSEGTGQSHRRACEYSDVEVHMHDNTPVTHYKEEETLSANSTMRN